MIMWNLITIILDNINTVLSITCSVITIRFAVRTYKKKPVLKIN